MSNRTKRKLENFDPNASDPEDLDWDAAPQRASPQKRRKRPTSAGRRKGAKRQRRGYSGSDVDEDDEILDDDSFTDRTSSEEPEVNPATGRSVRRATKKQITYEESEEDDEDEIQDSESERDELASPIPRRNKAQQSIERPSLIVKLKMAPTGRALRTRQGSKSIARGKTPEVQGTRRSNRLSHDIEDPIIALSDSGKHVNIVRQGTRSPEPTVSTRATRGNKGLVQAPEHSAIMEASQEESGPRDDSDGPIEALLADAANSPQVKASEDPSLDHEDRDAEDDGEGDDEMTGVIQESQHDVAEDDSEEEEGPVTRGGRNIRTTRAKSAKRKRGVEESSDFEPAGDEDKEEDEEVSEPEKGKKQSATSDESASGSGRRSIRNRRRTTRSRRRSESSDRASLLDADELAEEAHELQSNKRRRQTRRTLDADLVYDAPASRRKRVTNVDYRLVRPEQNKLFDEDENAVTVAEQSRPRGGRSTYRSLFSNQGPFGGGLEAGLNSNAALDSDSSDEEVQKMPKPFGGVAGMTPTTATAPGFPMPQTHNADPQQTAGAGGGPANLGKVKDKKALADADPLGVDTNVTFEGVGGLDDHINKLKEMVMLPLLYPEVFQRFKITPPRGVLFHGPPGTGKTLLARALASSVSNHGQKVTFYMRKGADALSKWVGEAEKQLRMLFEEARKTQPSIIFFDEIDGLAPVRSSKQEQIHASIVATLLALMDGMDGRGQVIVIGATNRPDSVDPALRRPGRFDREFYFPLPNVAGRKAILDIHTKNWEPPLEDTMKDQLAEITKGYGGADLRALCTEAALNAVQGTFPQIYTSEKKLLIKPEEIKVLAKDFMISVNKMTPSSQRTVTSKAAPLAKNIEPLLRVALHEIVARIDDLIPRRKKLTALEEAEYDDRDDAKGFEREATMRNFESSRIFRPRLLISGLQGMGQQYLGAALLNKLEGLHVQSFDLPTILEDPTRTPEAAVTQLFTEVRRHKPSVIYIPHVDVWYETLPGPAIKTFKLLMRSIGANEPILLLGVMERMHDEEGPDPQMMADLFSFSRNNQYELQRPTELGRNEFFKNVVQYIRMSPADFPDPDNRKKRVLPELPPAPVVEPVIDPKEIAAREKMQKKQDRLTLNKLKMVIQPVMDQLKKTYRKFYKPIIEEAWYAYLLAEDDPNHISTDLTHDELLAHADERPWARATDARGVGVLLHIASGNIYYNLDLTTIEKRLSNGYYKRPKDYLFDIKTLAKDAKTYNDAERTLRANEMQANVEVDIETIYSQNPGLKEQCEAVYQRELERARKAKEKQGKDVAKAHPGESGGTALTSGPITLGEVVPDEPIKPDGQPTDPQGSLTNGTSTNEADHASHENVSPGHSRTGEDVHMAESQDVPADTQLAFQTPNRPGTQTQRSQMSARTFMAPNSNPRDYQNSASTTNTSAQKTSSRSSGNQFNTQSSTAGVAPAGVPDLAELLPSGSQPIPDTQTLDPPHYQSSQFSNSEPSQSSQQNAMRAPPPPRHTANINDLLNDTTEPSPQLVLDENVLSDFHTMIVRKSSGCSVEQLEQVNATLMDAIWKHRAEWNRNVVLHNATAAFNDIILDIDEMQTILHPTQPKNQNQIYDDEVTAENVRPRYARDESTRQMPPFAGKQRAPYSAHAWDEGSQQAHFPGTQPPPPPSQYDSQIATQYGGGSGRQPQSEYRGSVEASQFS
ncbi:unnamed protein product [Periconia digitata]|uniref:Bromo domain-containing protein n=1 Tax=Periconia digitata TaxID=1303443 RepID=A0A9W4UKT6_9PLEO|nr:unnamed protein product [Periconia digitata]